GQQTHGAVGATVASRTAAVDRALAAVQQAVATAGGGAHVDVARAAPAVDVEPAGAAVGTGVARAAAVDVGLAAVLAAILAIGSKRRRAGSRIAVAAGAVEIGVAAPAFGAQSARAAT